MFRIVCDILLNLFRSEVYTKVNVNVHEIANVVEENFGVFGW